MKKWSSLLMSCLALGLVSAGCGSDDDETEDSGSAETTTQPAEKAPSTGAGGAVTVSMKNTEYVPKDVKVKVGGTIKWTNDDSFPHTVTKGSGPGPKFDSGTVDGGGTFEQKFAAAGKIDYVCTIHPNQTGTITVD